jgi:hypothetical protein
VIGKKDTRMLKSEGNPSPDECGDNLNMTSTHSFTRVLSFPERHYDPFCINGPIRPERRLKSRFAFDLSVRFRVLCGTPCYSGVGRAINVSSGGVLVSTEQAGSHHHLRLGAQVEMSFEWPAMLDGKIPLQLFAVGAVVRYTTSAFAATLVRYEFRTMNNSNQPHAGLAAAFGGCVEPKTNGRAAKS